MIPPVLAHLCNVIDGNVLHWQDYWSVARSGDQQFHFAAKD
ncbi:hypothetical protein FM101_14095 [Arthrobacter rhombi]|uniref:Uncharacterized protein n=1 Tax=Arthrobacter rhombi TaxID=71253 RepID=A0A1R4GUW6_9MICC|nr:hypothetical protein FM101_14095 [Arthrobacter rhombi]